MRIVVVSTTLLALAWAAPAAAQDHYLLQWKKTFQCEIVTTRPLFGGHYTEVGIYPSRFEAERALLMNRKRGICPADAKKEIKAPPKRPVAHKPRPRSTG